MTDPEQNDARFTLNIGVTGHREGNAIFDANKAAIEAALSQLFGKIGALLNEKSDGPASQQAATARLITNMAHGADVMAAELALAQGWEVCGVLPFGRRLNLAMNTPGLTTADMARLAGQGEAAPKADSDGWTELEQLYQRTACFELADQDDDVTHALHLAAKPDAPASAAQDLALLVAERARIASTVTVEQADLLIAIWDGLSPSALGGTRDTIANALAAEVPVALIDAGSPSSIIMLHDPIDLATLHKRDGQSVEAKDAALVPAVVSDLISHGREALVRAELRAGSKEWRPRSRKRYHGYRRIEAMFGGEGNAMRSLSQTYEAPSQIADGTGARQIDNLAQCSGADASLIARIGQKILPRFAATDGLSTYFSDAYRGGMVASFLLSAAAIIGGIAYLPSVGPDLKWPFALLEFVLLALIVAITVAGTRGQWHQRWFRLRRVAEYLRSAPILLSIGAARPLGRWPKSCDVDWPEVDARALIKNQGLPRMTLTREFLQDHLRLILRPFITEQQSYHQAKAHRLEKVHANLDRGSEALFILAILSVGTYLILKLLGLLAIIDPAISDQSSKIFTFLGVAFPTLGAALAGIRYFGDFERFATISDVTAAKLERLGKRTETLLASGVDRITYPRAADLAHSLNDIVIEEIESWQSIFGTKKMSVPV